MDMRNIAVAYIKQLSSIKEKEKLKNMVEHGIICGADFARKHEITPEQLTNELKLIFKGEWENVSK